MIADISNRLNHNPAKIGDFKVWAMRNFVHHDFYDVNDPEEAFELINNMSDADLKNSAITDNAFGLLVYTERGGDNGEDTWCEWFNSEYDQMSDLIRMGKFVL